MGERRYDLHPLTHSSHHPLILSPPHPAVHICLTLPMHQRTVNPMRVVLAGLLVLLFASTGLAQITGEVESIGYQSAYRPDCFTPMVIRIKAQAGASGDYQIQVKQNDLDADHVTFARNISVTGGEGAPDQRFLMYFLPQPTGG